MNPEQKATHFVRLRASEWGMKLFRNNSGVLINPNGVPVRFGLGNESKKLNKVSKSSDLIGVYEIEITEEMVGNKVGVFVALEAKPEGFTLKTSYDYDDHLKAQSNFLNLIKKNGGMAGFVSCKYDVDLLRHIFLAELKNEKN